MGEGSEEGDSEDVAGEKNEEDGGWGGKEYDEGEDIDGCEGQESGGGGHSHCYEGARRWDGMLKGRIEKGQWMFRQDDERKVAQPRMPGLETDWQNKPLNCFA